MTKQPITLKQARETKRLDQFAKERPSSGDEEKFDQILKAMTKPKMTKPNDKAAS